MKLSDLKRPGLSHCPKGQRAGAKCQVLQMRGLDLMRAGSVPTCPMLVPRVSGTRKLLSRKRLSCFPPAVPAFFKNKCHIVPQAFFERTFSKSRIVKIGCIHSSRTGIFAFIKSAFNADIRDMRGVRDVPAEGGKFAREIREKMSRKCSLRITRMIANRRSFSFIPVYSRPFVLFAGTIPTVRSTHPLT